MLVVPIALVAATGRPASGQDTAHVVIVATTDVHGHATAWDYVNDRAAPWGLARAATVVDSLRQRYPGEVLVLDAGDLIQGSPFATYFAVEQPASVHPVLDAMNAVGYDVITPGNHEFNFGLDVLARAYRPAAFSIVSGNIRRLPRDTLVYQPYVVLPRGGVRVGVTGFTTPGVMVWDRQRVAGRVAVRRILPAAEQILPLVRSAADLVVVAVHSGMGPGSSYDTTGVGEENVAARLAAVSVPPDLVVVGHSHQEMNDSVIDGVHFIQPQPWAQSLAVAHIWLARNAGQPWRVVRIVGEGVPLADVRPLPQVQRRLARAHEDVRSWVTQPLATLVGDWSARYARAEDTPIIDFINDVLRRVAGTQLSATAAFNVRGGFGPDAVRLSDVAGMYPYENTLKAVRIDGGTLRAYLERSARYFRATTAAHPINDSVRGYNYDIVSGVSYVIDVSRPAGSRIRQLTFEGQLVMAADTFTLALNSYRQAGGGGFDMLGGLPVVYDRGQNIRDLVVAAIRDADTLRTDAYFDPSWRLIPASGAARVRAVFGPPVAPVRDTILLRVLATNDLHGALESDTPSWASGREVGGAAALKGWMDSLAAECACPSVRLDGGDEWQGTPISNFVFGRSVTEIFDLIGYDAAAIGNHEFDWSIDSARARFNESEYAWLAANIRLRDHPEARPAWAVPWTMIERNGLKIAVIGVITESTPTTTNPLNVQTLLFRDGAESVNRVLPEVRRANPDFTFIVTHSGALCNPECQGEVVDLARGLDSASIDLIVSGHTHSEVNHVINGILIVQARARGTNLAVVDFVRRANGVREVRSRIETVWTDAVEPDSAVAATVARYAEIANRVALRPVARFLYPLPRERQRGEYLLGNLIADGLRNAARADVGLINNGGIRADLAAGRATYGDLFEVQPFGNQVVKVSVTGAELRAVLEHALSRDRIDAHISGITVQYDLRREVGRRVRDIRFRDNRRVRDRDTVTIAVPDFLAVGGSGYDMLVGKPLERSGLTDLDALIQYIGRLPQPIEVSTRRRWVERR